MSTIRTIVGDMTETQRSEIDDATERAIMDELEHHGLSESEASNILDGTVPATFDVTAVLTIIERLRDGVIQAGSETQSGWGRRLQAMMAPLGIDYGDAEDIERSLRLHYRHVFDEERILGSAGNDALARERYGDACHPTMSPSWESMTSGERDAQRLAVAEEASRYGDQPRHVLARLGIEGFLSYEALEPDQRRAFRDMANAQKDRLQRTAERRSGLRAPR